MRTPHRLKLILALAMVGVGAASAWAQFPITPNQRTTAAQVAQAGIPLNALSAQAPDRYTVKSGDTLWGISSLFLTSPWRWPELWGMNMNDIRNPHRIYPGQVLVLEKSNGRATLRVAGAAAQTEAPQVVRVSPRNRFEALADNPIPTIAVKDLEAFLAQPLLFDATGLDGAPRIVATQEGRVLLSRGDRAYIRSPQGDLAVKPGSPNMLRIVRNLVPLRDPSTREILAHEAEYVGIAELVRGEAVRDLSGAPAPTPAAPVAAPASSGNVLSTTAGAVSNAMGSAVNAIFGSAAPTREVVPATIDVKGTLQEARTGDRLVPEPPVEFLEFVPRAPNSDVRGQVVSLYGSAVALGSQNQVVVLNKGAKDGLERGHVLALLKDGERLKDMTQPARSADNLKLPDERNGLVLVYKAFDRVSYALILTVNDGLKVGDRFVPPR